VSADSFSFQQFAKWNLSRHKMLKIYEIGRLARLRVFYNTNSRGPRGPLNAVRHNFEGPT
jgi:hypothetical protein